MADSAEVNSWIMTFFKCLDPMQTLPYLKIVEVNDSIAVCLYKPGHIMLGIGRVKGAIEMNVNGRIQPASLETLEQFLTTAPEAEEFRCG